MCAGSAGVIVTSGGTDRASNGEIGEITGVGKRGATKGWIVLLSGTIVITMTAPASARAAFVTSSMNSTTDILRKGSIDVPYGK